MVCLLVELEDLLVPICDQVGAQGLGHLLDWVLGVFDDPIVAILRHVILLALEPI